MYSFYGGKQGITYNIVQRFDTIQVKLDNYSSYDGDSQGTYNIGLFFKWSSNLTGGHVYKVLKEDTVEKGFDPNVIPSKILEYINDDALLEIHSMLNEFQKGGSYTDVNYGLYVIIDPDLNLQEAYSWQRGILYRRGFNFNLTLAEFDPNDSLFVPQPGDSDLVKKQKKAAFLIAKQKYLLHPGAGAEYVGTIVGMKGDAPELNIVPWTTADSYGSTALLEDFPGFVEGLNVFNDSIETRWVTIRDEKGDTSGASISFKIPRNVFKISGIGVSNSFTTATTISHISQPLSTAQQWTPTLNNLIHEITSTAHPYFHDIQIAIPKGDVIDKIKTKTGTRNLISFASSGTVLANFGQLYHNNNWNDTIYLFCVNNGGVASSATLSALESSALKEGKLIAGAVISGSNSSQYPSVWSVINIPLTAAASLIQVNYKDLTQEIVSDNNFRTSDFIISDYMGNIYNSYNSHSQSSDITSVEKIGKINTILCISRYGDNLIALYSDKLLRQSFIPSNTSTVSWKGNTVYKTSGPLIDLGVKFYLAPITGPEGSSPIASYINNYNLTLNVPDILVEEANHELKERFVWVNYGSIGSQYHIYGNYESVGSLPSTGLDTEHAGWIVSVGSSATGYEFYAYDYIKNSQDQPRGWYKILDITEQTGQTLLENLRLVQLSDSQPGSELINTGLWFVSSSLNHSHEEEDENES